MSIRTVLIGAMLTVALVSMALVGALGVYSLKNTIIREAQDRVNHSINALSVYYEGRLSRLAERIQNRAAMIVLEQNDLERTVTRVRQELNLTVLNICSIEGKPLAGQYPEPGDERVPIVDDPVLRQARTGQSAMGTVLLDPQRLYLEGGSNLLHTVMVPSYGDAGVPATVSALFWWTACPIRDSHGRIAAILYGGQTLNHNYALVDELREMMFGQAMFKEKPLGTVTVFLKGCRVTTNVEGPQGGRAIGTFVSDEVRQKVLEEGEAWHDRALVVDAWYLSGYEPLRNPDGTIIGMLYLGMLEAPYTTLKIGLIIKFLVPVILVGALAVWGALYLGQRITRPIRKLSSVAEAVSRAHWEHNISVPHSYTEIMQFARVFHDMQIAIAERDRELQKHNTLLMEINAKLEQINRSYMETLGFVTHELKSPLISIKGMSSRLLKSNLADTTDEARHFLDRIARNSEELLDMVQNYLDLSRFENGELTAHASAVNFKNDVLNPVIARETDLLHSRNISLDVECPETLVVRADEELLQTVLTNYLTNAAKYGREGGKARITVTSEADSVTVCVWNEGVGFSPEQAAQLFQRFSRLRTEQTRRTRGSGLGLFLCRQIIELQGGRVWTESEPGRWAAFYFRIPEGMVDG